MRRRFSRLPAPRLIAMGALLGGAMLMGGCTQLRSHQGYLMDAALTDSIAAGIDNKESVEKTLGRPTFAGQFTDNDWYYVSRDTRQLAFASPRPVDQTILHVKFDAAGNVVAVNRTGTELVVKIDPISKKTPTLGREKSFFEEIFGNIGTVGAPGTGGGTEGP